LPGERDNARNMVHTGEEDHAWPGSTTSIRGQSISMTEDGDK